ncbi:MAG: LPS export ABC transporter periplasmic protein LptC [Rikenellaceae bacterium]|jgi:LPS export ABC transporter protein LptC|nr:LPS export ABC transporter periplasmic protein LptC [Rikenellaceae bacterium]
MSLTFRNTIFFRVALVLAGATLFISCRRAEQVASVEKETLITMQSTDLTVRNSVNGKASYLFETPLMERYELAEEPYMEFRRGVKITTYNDSTQLVESTLVADFAKYIEPKQLWEARGNVVGTNADGRVLKTEQLFWDEKQDRIYSVVRTQLTEGEDVSIFDSFETNSAFDDYRGPNPRVKVRVNTAPKRDSTQMEEAVVDSLVMVQE